MSFEELFESEEPFTVSEYTARLKRLLEGNVPSAWVVGEVSNLRRQSSGHVYFSLKDKGAQIPAVMFRGNAARLGMDLREGLEVVALGEISLYEPHGRYQLVVRSMRESGQGRLHQAFERLKQKLLAEGLFATERKRSLPLLASRVAIVTSPTGAAIQDFARILARRGWKGTLSVLPAKVQGSGAAEEIVKGIELANALDRFDVLVVGRGGGSLEDLWCFNEEAVARAIAGSRLPVISAVGHETDFTLSDFAADVRAETPSAAAELLSSNFLVTLDRIQRAMERMESLLKDRTNGAWQALRAHRRHLRALTPEGRMRTAYLQLDDLADQLRRGMRDGLKERKEAAKALRDRLSLLGPDRKLEASKRVLVERRNEIEIAMERGLRSLRERFSRLEATMKVLGPESTLKRGFAFVEKEDGAILSSVEEVDPKSRIVISLRDGKVLSKVESVRKKGEGS